jgi:FAD/FMN-containing dehydrogenase
MTTAIKQPAVETLRGSLRGELILPKDPVYETARKVHNGMIDRHPAVIVRPANARDVISAVNFARENRLTLAVRGGSHSVPGFGTCDDGLVIDLSGMKGVRVDTKNRTVRAEGGATWGDVDHATHAFGLAVPGGVISTTGIGGLTLGGGIGYLARKYGLSCDNMISADVVTADGGFVTASAQENADLFWALRGGSGNFGVVTSFEFRAHPVSTIFAGAILYPVEKSGDALRMYRDFMAQAPDDVNAFFAYLIVPPAPPFPEHLHNKTVCGIVCCYLGPTEKAEQAVRPLREFGPPLFEMVGPMPFPMLQSMFDALLPAGLQQYWKADFLNDLNDGVIDANVKYGPAVPTFNTAVHIYSVSGAVHKVGKSDVAFAYRDANFVQVIAAVYPDPADTPKNKAWVRDYWSALHPHSAGGAYVNMMGEDETEDQVRASYGQNYARLAEIKRKYDPTNLFHMNQNIKPG